MVRSSSTAIAACLLYGFSVSADAQSTPAPTSAASPGTLSETTKRQADNPYKWILIMDDKPRPKKEEVAAPRERKPVATPASATATTAPRPDRAVPASTTAAAAAPAAASTPAPSLLEATPTPANTPVAAAAAQLREIVVEEEPLKPVQQVQPELTRQIAQVDIKQGSVKVKFMVNPDGSVSSPEIVSTTNRVLNSSVLAALRQWRYEPRKEARETQVEFAFDFSR
jgi:TonB family protein